MRDLWLIDAHERSRRLLRQTKLANGVIDHHRELCLGELLVRSLEPEISIDVLIAARDSRPRMSG